MQRYQNVAQDSQGNALASVTVTVYDAGTSNLSTIYSDNGVTAKANPFTTAADGVVSFYAANGRYDVSLTKTGYTFSTEASYDIFLSDDLAGVGLAKVLTGTSATAYQWAVPNAPTSRFRNLQVRTHPDYDVDDKKIMLIHADEIVMSGGQTIQGWDRLVADITAVGAGGLDIGSEQASTWYEIHAIYGTVSLNKALMLHRAKDYFLDETFTSADTQRALRLLTATPTDKIAQGFKVDTTGPIPFVDVNLYRAGAVSGNVWFTIETDNAGDPSGTVVATSDKLDASLISTTAGTTLWRFVFRNPGTVTAATQYHLVFQGDYAKSDTIFIAWRGLVAGGYGNGASREYNGSTWAATGGATGLDRDFVIYVTRNDTALTMPSGYDVSCLVGYAYNDGSSNFVPMNAINKKVHPVTTLITIGSTSSAVPILSSLATIVPPVPVTLGVRAASGAAAGIRFATGVPYGYGLTSAATIPGAASYMAASVTAQVIGLVNTEFQGLYIGTAGAVSDTFYAEHYEW